jgi:hypothetical protein
VAGLVYADLEVTFTEAYELLEAVESSDLDEAQESWTSATDGAVTIVHCSKNLSVMDTAVEIHANTSITEPRTFSSNASISPLSTQSQTSNVVLRSLHFNDALDLVQSSVAVNASGCIDHSQPPPLWGPAGTAVQGLSLALPFRAACANARGSAADAPLSIVVLGAGACTLPAHLHAVFTTATITAIELDEDVAQIARTHFGIAMIEDGGRFRLHEGCAFAWTEANLVQLSRSVDVLMVDMQFGGDPSGLLAPPSEIILPHWQDYFLSFLADGGVVAINTVGTEEAVLEAARCVEASALCWVPQMSTCDTSTDHEGRHTAVSTSGSKIVHAVLMCGSSAVDANAVAAELTALPLLLDHPDTWLEQWHSPPPNAP